MKKILFFVLLLLCLVLSACSTNNTPGNLQESTYKALRCDAQNFSVLVDKNFTAASGEEGATIFIEDEDALNKVEVSVIHNGDTIGFDVTEYFYYRAEDMSSEDGIKYALYDDMTQTSFDNGVMSSAMYSFTFEDETAYRYEMLIDTGTQLINYSCYFCEGESDAPIKAMTDAIKSYQPSADYYDNNPLVIKE